MRRFLVLMALIAFSAPFAAAQDTDKRFEFFGGYSLLNADNSLDSDGFDDEDFDDFDLGGDDRTNVNGFNLAATGYVTPRFGFTGDFSYHQKTEDNTFDGDNFEIEARQINILGGPQVRFTNTSRVTPFVRALAGVANTRGELRAASGGSTPGSFNISDSTTDFALAIGGGLDVSVSDNFAVRLFQVDYNPVFLRDRTINPGSGFDSIDVSGRRLDNVRFSVGVVFK